MLKGESEIPIVEGRGDDWKLKCREKETKKTSFIFMSVCTLKKEGEKIGSSTIWNIQFKM